MFHDQVHVIRGFQIFRSDSCVFGNRKRSLYRIAARSIIFFRIVIIFRIYISIAQDLRALRVISFIGDHDGQLILCLSLIGTGDLILPGAGTCFGFCISQRRVFHTFIRIQQGQLPVVFLIELIANRMKLRI